MAKKKIYLVQTGYLQENTTWLPYAAGVLQAYSESVPEINAAYAFEEIIFLREEIEKTAESIADPFLVGFSCYVWNYEYNKALAAAVKKKYPRCCIVFGGHHVPTDASMLESCEYIDLLIHGEGEEVFALVLKALDGKMLLADVPNISYRENGVIINTGLRRMDGCDYPSAYLNGCFDSILKKHGNLKLNMLLESNRGCPYGCAYCDWGRMKQPVKFFALERIFAEIDWACEHGVDFIGSADANFGLYERDERITEYIVKKHNETGNIRAFQLSFAKGKSERVFRISKLLNSCGMNKGVTLSFQTMQPEVMQNVGRSNISVDECREMIELYNGNGIATYSELILGLPGETLESFVKGIDTLLNAGQHACVYIHNCEFLPCSPMAQKEYIKRYGIKTSLIELNQPHRDVLLNEEIAEYSNIVTKTDSMSTDDWVTMNLYAAAIQCFHFGGLLKFVAVYLRLIKNISYSDFYGALLDWLLSHDSDTCNTLKGIKSQLESVVAGKSGLTFYDKSFGNLTWSADEFLQLSIMKNVDNFYREIEPFLLSLDGGERFAQLLRFQQKTVKRHNAQGFSFGCDYDFASWLSDFLNGGVCGEIAEGHFEYTVNPKKYSFADYAKYVVWYGKKTVDKTYLSELSTDIG